MQSEQDVNTSRGPGILLLRGIVYGMCVVLLGLCGLFMLSDRAAAVAPEEEVLSFNFGDQLYPILFAGEGISTSRDVRISASFEPLFGADRAVVNPVTPEVRNGRELAFVSPGEYYLHINDSTALKVLVLSRDESISQSVVRVFDFCCANTLVSAANDVEFSRGSGAYLQEWFQSEAPAMLLCGPTYALFRALIQDRFGLPIRLVTFPGMAWQSNKLNKATHNVPEVYLPDLDRWVLFDVNNAFFVKWLDATGIAQKVKAASKQSEILTNEQWDAIDWNYHEDAVAVRRAVDILELADEFRPELVSDKEQRGGRGRMSLLYLGGPAYRGDVKPYGTDFLPARYTLGVFHDDPRLLEEAISWIASFDLEVNTLAPRELARLLAQGHEPQIRAQDWVKRFGPVAPSEYPPVDLADIPSVIPTSVPVDVTADVADDSFVVIPDSSRNAGATTSPVLFLGDRVRSHAPLVAVHSFEPAFGPDRDVVNPEQPVLDGRDLLFTSSGEYYLQLGDGQQLKACVLSAEESWSQSVVRIFDFCVANTVQNNQRIPEMKDRGSLLNTWFRQVGPVPLSSPDASKVFADLVTRALGLPVRFVSLPGVIREQGEFKRQSLYLPEVYLPDKGGFVLFDVINGWYAPWLDASGCARAIAEMVHESVDVSIASLTAAGLAPGQNTPEPWGLKQGGLLDDVSGGLSQTLLSNESGRQWSTFGHIYGGGVGYYGASRGKGTGTGFIDEGYTFGSLHQDPAFDDEVTQWIRKWYEDMTVVRLDELEQRLNEGHAAQLAKAPWKQTHESQ
jgi:hypothetical protein